MLATVGVSLAIILIVAIEAFSLASPTIGILIMVLLVIGEALRKW